MIRMPNDDTPWPLPTVVETANFQAGGLGQFAATARYARRIGCSEGPAARFLKWYFDPARETIALLRAALLKAGRRAGALLSDEVSNEFLATAGDEIVAALDARDGLLTECRDMLVSLQYSVPGRMYDTFSYCPECGACEPSKLAKTAGCPAGCGLAALIARLEKP